MDFQNLGKHCSDTTCKQKDFLPFNCKFCKQTYCLDHRDVTSHQCAKADIGDKQVIICPACSKTLTYDASTMSKDEYWSIHAATDCKPENYEKIKEEKSKACKGKGCKTKLTPLNTYRCRGCRKELCLKHRYEDQHDCFITYDEPPKPVAKEEPKKAPVVQKQEAKPHTHQNTTCASEYIEEFCTVCGRGFTNLAELISHAQMAHY